MTGPNVNPEVAAIAEERGVSLTQAYVILRRERVAAIDPSTVPQAIRDRILVVIGTLETDGNPDADMVAKSLQQMGYNENTHDVTHVLWSLQKTEHVRFRVSGRRGLHNIRLTDKGAERARMVAIGVLAIDTPSQNAVGGVMPPVRSPRAQYEAAHPRAQYPNGGAVEHIEPGPAVVDPTGEAEAAEVEITPVGPRGFEKVRPVKDAMARRRLALSEADDDLLAAYPLVRDLLARTKAAEGYVAAAKAVEALGEDDIALTLLSKSTVTPLEDEVARLLADLGVDR